MRAAFGRTGFVVLTCMQFLYPMIGKKNCFYFSTNYQKYVRTNRTPKLGPKNDTHTRKL